jgi:protein dithiol oxidoreductase (disulfide-forming)
MNNKHSRYRRNAILKTLLIGSISASPLMLYTRASPAKSPVAMTPVIEGDDYLKLERFARTSTPHGKIEVVEFFWYNCPHCNHFEPALNNWLKSLPKNVSFRRIPVSFRPEFIATQKLFYTIEAMGLLKDMHSKIFYAIHSDKIDLSTRDKIIDWISKQNNVNKENFVSLYDSFGVLAKANAATALQQTYKVSGVPALGVAGKYYTDGSLAKNMDRALFVVGQLVALETK